jgi:hypothetical protein
MLEEKKTVKVFRVTVKKVIERLLEIQDCPLEEFKELLIEKFDGYDYEGEEELSGFETWEDISINGEYHLQIKINHDYAYQFTLHIKNQDNKITIFNVL